MTSRLTVSTTIPAGIEGSPDAVVLFNGDGIAEYVNERWCRYTGLTAEHSLGEGWLQAVHPDDRKVMTSWRNDGASGGGHNKELRLRDRATNVYSWHLMRIGALPDENGSVNRWICTFLNLEDLKHILANERSYEGDFLTEMATLLASALDTRTMLTQLSHLIVTTIADCCIIYLLKPSGLLEAAATSHKDPAYASILEEMTRRYPLGDQDEATKVMETKKSSLVSRIAPAHIEAIAHDPTHLKLLRELGFCSLLTVPLTNAGETFGVMQLAFAHSEKMFQQNDAHLAEALASRLGIAIENAQLYERERRFSRDLQFAALPMSLPHIHGVILSGVYEPAQHHAVIGGDWYDALRLADGRLVISIGDVAGKGIETTAVMISMRQVIRGVALIHPDPLSTLDAADRILKIEYPDHFVTAFVGIFDPISLSFSYASAGHPPPMLLSPDHTITELNCHGLPLGVRDRSSAESNSIVLPQQAFLVLYTDGLTEETRDIIQGENRLRQTILNTNFGNCQYAAKMIYDSVLPHGPSDDTVVFTLALDPLLSPTTSASLNNHLARWTFESSDEQAARSVRETVVTMLERRGANNQDIFSAQLIFSELLGNAVRYAPGAIEVIMDCSEPKAPVLHMIDGGPGFVLNPRLPSNILSERGRGLFLIWSLTNEFNVTKGQEKGAHSRALLPMHSKDTLRVDSDPPFTRFSNESSVFSNAGPRPQL